ncbi:ComEA family DNA-binding protein [Gaetbulibacter saemankumensis]|uniref:ComEA family DNA-binding protein n=1 Tax=Gaetbulibacter saemankumensis TaxID=311208 RepID=UPI00040FB0CA|nr:helix-hairpin-helix domain-containing protein [Gaetbulibacter saemankumensis]
MKSHLLFSKEQRNGIFLLVLIIVALQCIYFFIDGSAEELQIDQEALAIYQKEIDSLKAIQIDASKPKIFPFNPNYITDYKGAVLGMSNEEIDRLLFYRKQDKWINSAKDFQMVTQVSDSLLKVISPYFKFPDWVDKSKVTLKPRSYTNKVYSFADKIDLNKATAQELQMVNGVGKVLSERIIKYRNKFAGGFIDDVQLLDVFGLSPEVIQKITNRFTVKTPRAVHKINLNRATVEELVTVQHIDYDLAHAITEARTLRDGFNSFDELVKVKDFPVNKIDIIKLYLSLD